MSGEKLKSLEQQLDSLTTAVARLQSSIDAMTQEVYLNNLMAMANNMTFSEDLRMAASREALRIMRAKTTAFSSISQEFDESNPFDIDTRRIP